MRTHCPFAFPATVFVQRIARDPFFLLTFEGNLESIFRRFFHDAVSRAGRCPSVFLGVLFKVDRVVIEIR